MRKLILALVLLVCTFAGKAQSNFDVKADALIDLINSELSTVPNFNRVNWSGINDLVNQLRSDPQFTQKWNNYIVNETFERPTLPIGCIAGAVGAYNSCVNYYNEWCETYPGSGIIRLCHGMMPPAPPGYPGNYCEYQMSLALASCYTIPGN